MAHAGRGRLKVYMGYAAGVGKTYRMLEEAQQLRQKGVDIVIGYFEPHGRQETIAKTVGLESVPPASTRTSAPPRPKLRQRASQRRAASRWNRSGISLRATPKGATSVSWVIPA